LNGDINGLNGEISKSMLLYRKVSVTHSTRAVSCVSTRPV
jgi:hypothetical protein